MRDASDAESADPSQQGVATDPESADPSQQDVATDPESADPSQQDVATDPGQQDVATDPGQQDVATDPSQQDAASAYLSAAWSMMERVRTTQLEAIESAAEICADTIARRGLVHLFGTGHSRILIEEIFPRHGSFPGFHPIVELSLTYHNQVVGANGQRQAMYLEHVEGLGGVILRNFVLEPPDSFIVISNGGVNEVVVDVALEASARGLPVISIVSRSHCDASAARHGSGKKLPDVADVTIDNCSPAGDAMVRVRGLEDPVGPGSTVGGALVVNALKCRVAEKLVERGEPPIVLTSSYFLGAEGSRERFEVCYDDYRARMVRALGGEVKRDR